MEVQHATECHPAQCFTPFRVVKMPISINKMRAGPLSITIKPRDTFGTHSERFRRGLREPRPLRTPNGAPADTEREPPRAQRNRRSRQGLQHGVKN
jgi:hypothetical protein